MSVVVKIRHRLSYETPLRHAFWEGVVEVAAFPDAIPPAMLTLRPFPSMSRLYLAECHSLLPLHIVAACGDLTEGVHFFLRCRLARAFLQ